MGMKIAVFGDFWDPAGTEKSTKNGPAAGKVGPETVPEPIFLRFLAPLSFGVGLGTDFWRV